MIPKKPAPDVIRGGYRFSDKIMLKQGAGGGNTMTPQERELIADLFDRLASLERNPRDPQAEAAIREGFRDAPNALYALVQTVLVQDEALKAANARIQQYEGDGPAGAQQDRPRGFLDNMRDQLFGRDEPRGSVPRVPQAGAPPAASRPDPWGRDRDGPPPAQQPYQQPYQQQPYADQPRSGGSFLGTAAAAAAGVIGGSLLMGGIRSVLGGHQAGPFSGAFDHLSGRDPGNAAGELSREAGLNDIGGRGRFDQAQQDTQDDAAQDALDDQDQAQDDTQDASDDDSDTA
jgi:hypothetical protein